jgi:hypothetical protein
MNTPIRLASLSLVALLAGCGTEVSGRSEVSVDTSVEQDSGGQGSADTSVVDDTTVADTTVEDTAVEDTTVEDTAVADTTVEDTAVADTTVEDTAVADTTGEDTAVEDTTVDDTAVADTAVADTTVADTTVEDTTDTTVDDTTDTTVDDTTPPYPPAVTVLDPNSFPSPPYLMWVTQTAVSVRWETAAAEPGVVRFGYAPDALTAGYSEGASRTTHEVRLEGLLPGSTVYYAVGNETAATPAKSFRTAPADGAGDAFSFVVFGDNQNGPANFAALTPRMAALDPDFAMSTGDCVQNGTRAEFRSQLFRPLTALASTVPFLVGAGNHERYSDPGSTLFNEYMSQPDDEHCFGWRYGSMFVLFIDTEDAVDPGTPQRTCIENQLGSEAATSATYRAAVFHKPPRIEFWLGGRIAFPASMEAPQVRNILEPLFASYNVNIVFNGHNHLYAHTPELPNGITWVTTGGAGGTLDTQSFFWRVGTWPEIDTQISEFHFLHVNVVGSTMSVDAIATNGSILHSFSIRP